MELNIVNSKEVLNISEELMSEGFNEGMIHEVVTSYLVNARSGTKAQKSRSEVRGGGIKPWRQKGTGRARAGTIRSPIWRTGGVTFAAKPRTYKAKVNKKVYKKAMRSILAELIRQERLTIIQDLALKTHKTSEFKKEYKDLIANKESRLFIVSEIEENLYYATRNLCDLFVIDAFEANPYDLVAFDKVVITVDAFNQLQERIK